MIQYIKYLLIFAKRPSPYIYENNKTTIEKTRSVFIYYLWEVVFLIPIVLILALLDQYGLLPENANTLNTISNFWENLFLICLAIPFLEEVIFRSHLSSPRWSIVASLVSVICSVFFVVSNIVTDFNSKVIILISTFIGIIYSFFVSDQYLRNIWQKYYPIIFYIMVLAFTLVHLTNFDYKKIPLILFPLLLIAQFIGGIFLGFIRVRYGFWYSVLSHCWFNFVLLIIKYVDYST